MPYLNIKKIILVTTVIIFTIVVLFTVCNMKNSEKVVKRSAIRISLLNDSKERSSEVYSNATTVTSNFEISSEANLDIVYDVILLTNYKQKNFSVNNSDFKEVQKIYIPKSESIITTNITLSYTLDNNRYNDCMIILTPDYKQNYHIVERFSVISLNHENSINNQQENKSIISDVKVGDITMCVLENNNIESLSQTQIYDLYKGVSLDKNEDQLEVPIYYRVKDTLIEDINNKKFMNTLVFALEDNKIVPIFNDNLYKKFIVSTEESNILPIKINASHKNEAKEITFFLVNLPFTRKSEIDGCNTVGLWDNVIHAQNKLLIN